METNTSADPSVTIDPKPAREALAWPSRAAALVIATHEQYSRAGEFLRAIKGLRNTIAETFRPHISRAHEAHRALVAEQKKAEAPLIDAETILKAKLVSYDEEQERIRRQEEARLRNLARQEEERRHLEQAAAMEREAAATGDTQLQAEAEALLDTPIETPVVSVEKATPKVAGLSYSERWSAVVTDKTKLVAYVAANPQYLNLVDANMPALNGLARSLKQAMAVPGVQATSTRTVASGR